MAASSQLRFWTKQKDKHSKSSFKGRKTTTGTIRHSKNILNIVQPKCFIETVNRHANPSLIKLSPDAIWTPSPLSTPDH